MNGSFFCCPVKCLIYATLFLFGFAAEAAPPKKIALVATTPIPDNCKPNKELFKQVRECGFDIAFGYVGGESSMDAMIEASNGTGIKLMPASSILRSDKCGAFVSKYKGNPSIVGWDFVDEPKYENLDKLRKYYQVIKNCNPNFLIYISLIGVPNKSCIGPNTSYAEYLDDIEKIFNPDVWAYDLYPIYEKNRKLHVKYEDFYRDLELFSQKSKETGQPFWSYCQSMAVKFANGASMPAATVPYLRFEAFSALAYGAQGLVYWTYGQRLNQKNETYLSALVDLDGNKTPAWYAAQQVNNEINALNFVFYKSELVDCRHTGDAIYGDAKRLTGAMGPLNRITTGSSGVIVSHLITGGKNYLVIVSRDPFGAQTVRLNFRSDCDVAEIRPIVGEKGNDVSREKVSGNVRKRLDAGGYAIYQWE